MSDIIIWAGLVPRFCDVDESTLGVTASNAELCINENTAVILAPHPISNLCDIEGMEELSEKYDIPILFDAVEACGGCYKGKKIGSFGDAESFSLHPSKIVNGAEGGYITTNNSQLAQSLGLRRDYGMNEIGEVSGGGCNFRLNEMHASLALASLSNINGLLEENKKHHIEYQKHIDNIAGLRVVKYPADDKRNWKSVLVELEDAWPLSREQTLQVLNEEMIWARSYYAPAQHISAKKQVGLGETPLPVAISAMEKYMLLPFGFTVSKSDIVQICGVLMAIETHSDDIKSRLRSEEKM
jgi:dTDP-4-amino-4,6-dideoxygalactose transaminase